MSIQLVFTYLKVHLMRFPNQKNNNFGVIFKKKLRHLFVCYRWLSHERERAQWVLLMLTSKAGSTDDDDDEMEDVTSPMVEVFNTEMRQLLRRSSQTRRRSSLAEVIPDYVAQESLRPQISHQYILKEVIY